MNIGGILQDGFLFKNLMKKVEYFIIIMKDFATKILKLKNRIMYIEFLQLEALQPLEMVYMIQKVGLHTFKKFLSI